MKIFFIIVIFISILPLKSFAETEVEGKIKSFCSKKWGADYSMQKYCIDKQTNAFVQVVNFKNNNIAEDTDNNPYASILKNCLEKWKVENHTFDWAMTNYCIEKQSKAYGDIYN